MTTDEETKDATERAVGWYAQHQIVSESADRWMLRKPGTSNMWAEIAVLAKGTLLVHGDTDPVLFGHMTDCRRPENAVHWMARSAPDDHYFVQKAGIAMGCAASAVIWTPSIKCFREELSVMIDELHREHGSEHPLKQELEDILARARDDEDDISSLQKDVYDCGVEGEDVPKGRVISQTMICAWAAIRRLSTLLKAREAEAESKAIDELDGFRIGELVAIDGGGDARRIVSLSNAHGHYAKLEGLQGAELRTNLLRKTQEAQAS